MGRKQLKTVRQPFWSPLPKGQKEFRDRHCYSRAWAGLLSGERRTKIPQHPGIVCRDFVQREGTDEAMFVLTSPYATFGEEGVGGQAYGPPTIPFSLLSIPEAPGPLQLPSEDRSGVGWNWGAVNPSKCHRDG